MQASGCQPLPEPVISRLMAMLQSTRPHGARLRPPGLRSSGPGFNPRARTGRDKAPYSLARTIAVSIHAPARGATGGIGGSRNARGGFNPRARTGRDRFELVVLLAQIVSIHAPARGATTTRKQTGPRIKRFQSTRPHGARLGIPETHISGFKFQSTRPHGARPVTALHASSRAGFNPRARTGRDASCACVRAHSPSFNPRARTGRDQIQTGGRPGLGVSIHAPARGATLAAGLHVVVQVVSIHAPARGATPFASAAVSDQTCFNPRARTGRDMGCAPWSLIAPSFNPRARTGRDRGADQAQAREDVSIHAPARGATTTAEAAGPCLWSFNPRARTGRDRGRSLGAGVMDRVSIHAPARGATQVQQGVLARERVSIHAPARGATGGCCCRRSLPSSFNPRARTGRDIR
ncbi:hypothetical protein SAMN05421547_11865 [Delftia lacustris]|uniref:Uncharacterized protein n=1 Tax=Delftia lacustris TaxID=558537 RepID=A0A1H3S5C5_9BURK|nr:hypothetical protein SAMN05421547_11865 [Delftia lacustris]